MQITLRTATLKDAPLLYHLLKERPPYANISHSKMPTMDEHVSFIKKKPYAHWYIIEGLELNGTKDVGSCYLTERDEIGIAILRKYWRQGHATCTIKELIHLHPREKYLANISPVNMTSQRLFKKAGFNILQYTLEYDNT